MEYKLDYKELHNLNRKIDDQSDAWLAEIVDIQNAIRTIINTGYVTGEGANSFKQYFNSVHYSNLELLKNLVIIHKNNCISYEHDYLKRVSGDSKTHVETAEIKEIKTKLERQRGINERLHNEIASSMGSVKDIINVSYPDEEGIHRARSKVSRLIDALNEAICSVESQHINGDFDATRQIITSLKALISANINKGRSFNSFSNAEYVASAEYAALSQASELLISEYSAKSEKYIAARNSYESLEAEYREERERFALLMKVGVVVLTTVTAIALSAVLGPVAAPIVVGTVNGMISSGANTAIDAYTEDGEIDRDDFREIAYEGAKGAVIGGITGIIGSGVGIGLDRVADNMFAVPLSSTNEVVRLGTGVVVGSAKKVVNSAVERGIEETLDQVTDKIVKGEEMSYERIRDKVFDSKKISEDVIWGGLGGGLNESKRLDREVKDGSLNRSELKDRGDNLYSYEKRIRKTTEMKEELSFSEKIDKNLHGDIDSKDVADVIKGEYKVVDTIIHENDEEFPKNSKSSKGGGEGSFGSGGSIDGDSNGGFR